MDAPGSLHHVIVRGIERRKIFENDKDRKDFIRRLGQVVIEEQAACFAWSLLPYHAHILLRTGSIPLAKMMRRKRKLGKLWTLPIFLRRKVVG